MLMKKRFDIREEIFQKHITRQITAALVAEQAGVLSGLERVHRIITSLGLVLVPNVIDGGYFEVGQEIVRVAGNPIQIAEVEERLIGALSKFSGIATAARAALKKAKGKYQIVSGGWKKMPFEIKEPVRQAVIDGGLNIRISDQPFVYLDKNYVRILGGVQRAVETVSSFQQVIVVQIKGETCAIAEEAVSAVQAGADVIMVDTGNFEHLRSVGEALTENGLRSAVQIAFAGNIKLCDLYGLFQFDLDIVDIGYAILDAPCIPMRFDVIETI